MFACQFYSQIFPSKSSMQAHIRRDRCAFRDALVALEQLRQQENVGVDVDMIDAETINENDMTVSSSNDGESTGKK